MSVLYLSTFWCRKTAWMCLTTSWYHSTSLLKFEWSLCSFWQVFSTHIYMPITSRCERSKVKEKPCWEGHPSFGSPPPTSMYSARDAARGGSCDLAVGMLVRTAMTVSHTMEWIFKGGATLETPAQSRSFNLMRLSPKIPKPQTKFLELQ